jgi:hypothetical protein
MYVRIRRLLIVLVAAASPSFAGAQNSNAPSTAAGPRIDAIATGFRAARQPADSTTAAQRRRQSRPVALMIVGGAAFVLGALIGHDVGVLFMIGGAVALLIGLYRYLQ